MNRKITFRYDAEQDVWTECGVPAWQTDPAENLPALFIVDLCDERTGEKGVWAWCEAHRDYEKIARYTADGCITEQGCTLRGLAVFARLYIEALRHHSLRDTQEVPLRWQVRHIPEDGSVELSNDAAIVSFDWIRNEETGHFVLAPFLHSVKHAELRLSLRDEKQPDYFCHIPVAVAAAAMTALRAEAAKLYGFAPPMVFPTRAEALTFHRGRREEDASPWLLAFLHRPLDMRIWFFLPFFDEEKFDELFPRTQADNFPTLCRAIDLTPTAELKADYEKRGAVFPLRPALRELLPTLGVRREPLTEKFMDLSRFCGEDGMSVYLSRRSETAGEKPSDLWDDLRFYCDWRRQSETEEALAAHLLDMQGSWRAYNGILLRRFRRYFDHIPQSVKDELLRQGLTADVYDKIAILVRDRESKSPDRNYSVKERALECRIGGYNFRLLTSIAIRRQIFSYNTHVYSGGPKDFDSGNATMVGVEKNGAYLGIISVRDGVATPQLLPYWSVADDISVAKIRIAYLRWMLHNGLTERFVHEDDCRQAPLQELPVEPLGRDEEWDGMGLWEMLELPGSAIRPGYYLELFRRFMETDTLRPYPPTAEDDERACLMRRLPWGKRIFDAAWAGDPEAQYVMSLFYHRYCHRFASADARLSAAWYKRACENGWADLEASGPEIRLDGVCAFADGDDYKDRGGFFVG